MRFFFLGHPRWEQDDESVPLPVRGDCPSTPLAATYFDDWFGHPTTVRPPTDNLGLARRVTFYPQPPVDKGLACHASLASLGVMSHSGSPLPRRPRVLTGLPVLRRGEDE